MTDKIEPALSAEEWAKIQEAGGAQNYESSIDEYGHEPKTSAYMIALWNSVLPDSDPRKITREMVLRLRTASDLIGKLGAEMGKSWASLVLPGMAAKLRADADALESYLPPER